MNIKYNYIFEKHGQSKGDNGIPSNHVWIDVGNALEMGCFDHHQDKLYKSSLDALVDKIDYLDDLINDVSNEVYIHIHELPDLDSVACTYAIEYILEHGKEQFDSFIKSEDGKTFIEYISDIDVGRKKNTSVPTLYAIFCLLDMNKEKGFETDKYVVDEGLAILDIIVNALKENVISDLYDDDLSTLLGEKYNEQYTKIRYTFSNYERNKEKGIVTSSKIKMWTEEGEQREVDAFIWKEPTDDTNEYNYARQEGAVFTILPERVKGINSETTSVVASINRDIDVDGTYTLKPIVEIVELLEQIEEQSVFEQTGYYRRNHSRPRNYRENEGYLNNPPFSVTSDPWYMKPEEDLFASPGDGSILPYDTILEIIKNNGSLVKKSYIACIEKDDIKTKREIKNKSISVWQNKVREITTNHNKHEHIVVFAELDASLIMHSNKILEAYCLNLIGSSINEGVSKTFLKLDYRTCIYSDLNYTIILVGTYEGENHGKTNFDSLQVSKVLNIDTLDKFTESELIKDVKNIFSRRSTLLDFGRQISKLKPNKRKEIELLYSKMLSFSADVQEDDMKSGLVQSRVYSYLKDEFEIEKLEQMNIEKISIITSESRERMVSKFNIISSVAVPFVLVSTLFQMGILKFESLLELKDYSSSIWGWLSIFILVIALTILILIFGNKKDK